jgi:hypothetical protein
VTTVVLSYCLVVRKPMTVAVAVAVAVVVVVAAGLVLAGCADDSTDQSALLGNRLLHALGRVRATAQTRTSVEYGEPAAVKALVDNVRDKDGGNDGGKDNAKDKLRYQMLQGVGYSSVSMYSEAEGLVRVTVPPRDSGPVGQVLAVMRNGDLAGLE